MLEDLSLTGVSASALLAIAVLLVLTGLLVPRRQLKDKDEEAQRWRNAYEAEKTARAIADSQTSELLEVARTTHTIIEAMAATSAQIRRSGGPHAPTED